MVGIQFQIAQPEPEQVNVTPQENIDRTQHTPSNTIDITTLLIIAVVIWAVTQL